MKVVFHPFAHNIESFSSHIEQSYNEHEFIFPSQIILDATTLENVTYEINAT